ncbi:ATP-binding protein [Marinilabiliaceae bacterium ANBcel2]|nr:ATP-binding protein [Marinilabiliaceae bacterium ANBcel2]
MLNIVIITAVQQVTFLTLAMLGIAMMVFFGLNLRKNINRRHSTPFQKKSKLAANDNIKNNNGDMLLNIHPVPTAICNKKGVVEYLNNKFAKVFGSIPENMKDLLLHNILPNHISNSLFNVNDEFVTKGRTKTGFYSPNTHTRYCVHWEIFNYKGDDKLWVTLEYLPEIEEFDITAEKSKHIIRQILDIYPFSIFIEDYEGIILEVNKSACKLHGKSREELLGTVVPDLTHGDFKEEVTRREKSLAEKGALNFKSVLYPDNSRPVPVEIQVNRINYFGIEAFSFIVNNLTEVIDKQKELDEYKLKAEESDRLKSSFLANLSHEVRTPMNTIMGFSELIAEPLISNEEKREYIRFIRKSGKELITQINNMIHFSKLEAGLINLNLEKYSIEELFFYLHEHAQEIMGKEKLIKIFFELPEALANSEILTDRNQLKKVLEIFVTNAIKYTEEGVVEVSIKQKDQQIYEFTVRDTGIGIAEEKHRLVFEKFRQAEDTDSRSFTGMGLGLSIAARLIQFLGGHQWVVSKPGKGSEFKCVIPDMIFPQESPVIQVSGGPSTLLKKVMIISSVSDIYINLNNDSKPANYQVFWAQNAQEMYAMLISNKIKFILIDIDKLPFWEELIARIKLIDNQVQLIGITERLTNKRKSRLLSVGLHEVIKMPVNIPLLENIVEKNTLSSLQSLTSTFFHN